MKKQIALFLAGWMALQPLPVYAAETAEAQTPQSEEVATKYNSLVAGQKGQPLNDIYLTESAPGLFQKNKAIYLQIDGDVFLEEGAEVEVVRGDLKIRSIETDGNLIKLVVEKASGQTAAIIRLTQLKATVPGDTPYGVYSLNLITKNTGDFQDNTLGGVYDTEAITLLKEFAYVRDRKMDDDLLAYSPRITAILGEDALYVDDRFEVRKVPLGAPMYLAEDGSLMLPVRAFFLGQNRLSELKYNPETKDITINQGSRILQLTVGNALAKINGTDVTLSQPVTVSPEGYAFVALSDFLLLAGCRDGQYDVETTTLTIQ